MKLQSRFAIIAITIAVSLIISTLAVVHSAKASSLQQASVTSTHTAEAQPETAPRALVPDRPTFQPKLVLLSTTPNFARPIRRAPVRRKGRVQH